MDEIKYLFSEISRLSSIIERLDARNGELGNRVNIVSRDLNSIAEFSNLKLEIQDKEPLDERNL